MKNKNTSQPSIDPTNADPQYWEKILEAEGLGLQPIEDTIDEERQQVWKTLEGSLQRDHHRVFSVPRSQEELIQEIYAAVRHLSLHHDPDITWKIHTSCSFGCDCIVLAAKGKKALHINSYLVPAYDRDEVIRVLNQIGTEDDGVYE